MNYEEFCIWMKERLEEMYGDRMRVELRTVRKNNGIVLDALTMISERCNLSPTIYLNEFFLQYENGMLPEDILERIKAVYENVKREENIDFDFYTNYEIVQERIACKLINKKANEALLKEVPWVPMLDLAIVFYYLLPEYVFVEGTILIRNEHCENWKVTAEDLLQAARMNMDRLCPIRLYDMHTLLKVWSQDMCDGSVCDRESFWVPIEPETIETSCFAEMQMYIITNEKRNLGAINAFRGDVIKRLAIRLNCDIYVLPSSIHECILVPIYGNVRKDELGKMVREVNASCVEQEEVLSDKVYRYILSRDGFEI